MDTSNMTRVRIDHELVLHDHHDFGFDDEKGRRIGTIATVDRVERVPDEHSSWLVEPDMTGVWFRASIHATRDGRVFGASTQGTMHVSFDEAVTALSKKIDAARVRYARKYHGGPDA